MEKADGLLIRVMAFQKGFLEDISKRFCLGV